MLVTKISDSVGKKHRIYIDDNFAFSVYYSEIKKYKLKLNYEISEEQYLELKNTVTKRLRDRVFYLLADTAKSERDIRMKMIKWDNPTDIIEDVILQLKEYGYINDLNYARAYAESLRDNRYKSIRAIQASLYGKGIAREVVDQVLSDFEIDEYDQILYELRKKRIEVEQISKMDRIQVNKLYQSMARKGFSYDILSRVFKGE